MPLSRPRRALVALVALSLLAAGCGDDDDDDDAASEATEDVADDDTSTTAAETGDAAASGSVEVTGVDYAFEGLPESVAAGTKLTLKNGSDKELHELVAMKLPDGEARSAEELLQLPEDQLGPLFGGPPAMVLVAPPGGAPMIPAVGDGTLSEPGRYLIMCSIPTGADPQAYMEAAQASQGGPPEVEGGPPHFTQGMFGEVTVE